MQTARSYLTRVLDRLQPSESVVLGGAAVVVGLLSGAGVWAFKGLIDLFHRTTFDQLGAGLSRLGPWSVALLPILGGLVVGWIMHTFVGEERHHGVAGIMESVALAGGRLRYWRIPAKALAAALSIGTGASVGPEDPSVQIGANLGSFAGQNLRLSDERVRALVAGGAAGGIAAAFNAPIAGIFFAVEIILGELGGRALSVVVLAAVISSVFTQAVAGTHPAFAVPSYPFRSGWELPLYLGLGLLAGPVAALYIRAIYAAQDFFHGLAALPRWLKPALAGAVVGLVGLFLPQVFGVGYETIQAVLEGQALAVGLLLALLAAKLLMTAVSIGGGFPGGVFAPSLFLGTMLGATYGLVLGRLLPGLGLIPAAFAMVGMAAVLAATVHAPLTAILLLFEMTNDYRIILPVMLAVVAGLVVEQQLVGESVYSLGLVRKGVRLERGRDVEVLDSIRVDEVMLTAFVALREADSLTAAADVMRRRRVHGLPVVDRQDAMIGVLTLQDIDRAMTESSKALPTVGQVCTRDVLVAYPDETIGAAMRRMGTRDIGLLPVVARDNPRRALGLLRRTHLVRAYDAALAQRAARRHQAQQVRLGAMHDALNVHEVVIQPYAPCAGRLLKNVAWPRDSVIASLRRRSSLVIPHGDTELRAGDVLVVIAEGEALTQIQRLCESNGSPGTV